MMSKQMMSKQWLSSLLVVVALLAVVLLASSPLTRPVAASTEQAVGLYHYSVKFVCGKHGPSSDEPGIVRPGMYATEINIHNPHNDVVDIRKHFIVLVAKEEALGREPEQVRPTGFDGISLYPDHATMDDCRRIREMAGVDTSVLTIGYLELISPVEIVVDAVYTTSDFENRFAPAIEVERVEGKLLP